VSMNRKLNKFFQTKILLQELRLLKKNMIIHLI